MRLLNEALDQSERAGLTQHPIRARTFVTLGIVSLGGFRQRDQAVKYFRRALQIQPEVRLSPGLANPDIQAAFDEAIAGLSTPGGDDLPPEKALVHEPVRVGEADKPVPILVVPDKDLDADLGGAALPGVDGVGVHGPDDEEGTVGRLRGGHPGVGDDRGACRVLHRSPPGQRLGAGGSRHRGRSDRRRAGQAHDAGRGGRLQGGTARPAASDKRLFFAILGGTGFGWASGTGEATLGTSRRRASTGRSWGRWCRRSATWSRRGS